MPGGPTITAATTSSELQPPNHKLVTDSEWEGEGEAGVYANTTKSAPANKPRSSKTRGVKSPFWSSHRYKNLLGFLPVGIREEVLMKGPGWGHDEVLEAMEMVVVERPMWDIKMPPRFYKGGVER
jgi:U3 small nucleolar RNA-associated protein 4